MDKNRWVVPTVFIIAVAAVVIFWMMASRQETKIIPVPGPVVTATVTPAPAPTVTVTPVPVPTVTVTVTPKPTPTYTIAPANENKAIGDMVYNFVAVRGVGNVEGMLGFMTSKMAQTWVEGDIRYYSDGYWYTIKAVEGNYATVVLKYKIVETESSNGDREKVSFVLENTLYLIKWNGRWLIATPSVVPCIVYTH